ncbi:MAG: glycosyltransferase family 39 protein [Candidatus Cloacimonetes bacterium]|nr:glycosyltransferase family 39 protein [Candidatus Cloacimonadota bacterium]
MNKPLRLTLGDNTRGKLLKAMLIIVWLLLFAGFAVKALDAALNLDGSGDEGFFLKELASFQTDGLWRSFADGISHLHVLLVSAVAAVVGSPLLAGRLLNIILLVVALFLGSLIIKNLNLRRSVELVTTASYAYMLVFSQVGKTFYRFINDPLMIVLALFSLYLFQQYYKSNKTWFFILASIASGMMFWVRSFSLLIWAGILAFLILQAAIRKPRLKGILLLACFVTISIAVALLVQIPSISENGRLAFENKSGEGDWGARNWVTRYVRRSNGGIFSYQRVDWDEIERFKQEYGENAIPSSLLGKVRKDPKFMADNFVSNLIIRIPYVLLASIGIYFLLFLDLLRRPRWLFEKDTNQPRLLFLLVAASVSLGVSLIIINYIEQRWLMAPVICVLLLAAVHLDRRIAPKWSRVLLAIQCAFLMLTGAGSLAAFIL